jgi:hypothetical protein
VIPSNHLDGQLRAESQLNSERHEEMDDVDLFGLERFHEIRPGSEQNRRIRSEALVGESTSCMRDQKR